MNTDLTFEEIWNTLSKVDVSEYTEKKGDLTYLSWARAWLLLMENFAHAEYEFVDWDGEPYRIYPDGTGEVITKVTIGSHTRYMSLPIMDYKNQPIINANSRQVNDNRMRCLVKNLAMGFGLGMSVFAVWDDHLPNKEKDKQPKGKKELPKEVKKVVEKLGDAVEEVTLVSSEHEEEFDEQWADVFVEATEKLIVMQESTEQLKKFYKDNAEGIGRLKSNFPEHKAQLDKVFVKHADSLGEEDEK